MITFKRLMETIPRVRKVEIVPFHAFAKSRMNENAPIIWTKLGRKMGDFLFLVVKAYIK